VDTSRRSAAERAVDAIPRWLQGGLHALNAAVPGRLTRGAATRLAASPPALLTRLEPVVLERLLRPAACCPEGGVHYRFIQRYLDVLERPGARDFVARALAAQGPERAGRVLDAYARMVAVGLLRHEALALGRRRGAPPPALLEVQLAAFPECDLDCAGCYGADRRGGRAPGIEEIAFVVDEAAACGAWAVHVVGCGEPFLSERRALELLDVIAARPYLMFSIATSGVHVTERLADRLAALGNVLLLVSVDGCREVHDARRGPGAFDRVMRALETLRRHRLLFGFSSMVSRRSHEAVTSSGFVGEMAAAGCALGIYSRYFPLSAAGCDELRLTPAALAGFQEGFERARALGLLPLLDLDEAEGTTGCRSRAGLSVFVDAATGQVSPCLKVPFAPPECRLDRARGIGLARVLAHPFFAWYRDGGAGRPACCGLDPGAELDAVSAALDASGAHDGELRTYRARWAVGGPPRPEPLAGRQEVTP
jgi:sulfatase maturation enzyme AslB (radical SAM superfamily)